MNFTNPSDCKTNLLPDGSQAPLHAFNTGASVYVGSGFSGLASAFIIITFWYVRQPHLHALRSGAHFVSFLSFFLSHSRSDTFGSSPFSRSFSRTLVAASSGCDDSQTRWSSCAASTTFSSPSPLQCYRLRFEVCSTAIPCCTTTIHAVIRACTKQ